MAHSKEDILTGLLPSMKDNGTKFKIWNAFLLLVIGWGMYGLWIQLTQGHIVTGMRDHVVWGIYIVNFIFFIGLGYSGSVLAALLYLAKVKWRTPIVRVESFKEKGASCLVPNSSKTALPLFLKV